MELDKLARLRLCALPTPLMEAPTLSKALGGPRILIKRDDLTGLAMGGNKSRPMEFIMTEAKQKKADVLVAAGYQGSNWVSNLVAAARKTRMDVVLFLLRGDRKMQGNLLLYKLLGAEIRFTDLDIHERAAMYEQMDRMAEGLREKGRRPYVMYYEPVGPLGIASYVILARDFRSTQGAGNQRRLSLPHQRFRLHAGRTHRRRKAFSDPPQGHRRYAQPPGYQGG